MFADVESFIEALSVFKFAIRKLPHFVKCFRRVLAPQISEVAAEQTVFDRIIRQLRLTTILLMDFRTERLFGYWRLDGNSEIGPSAGIIRLDQERNLMRKHFPDVCRHIKMRCAEFRRSQAVNTDFNI